MAGTSSKGSAEEAEAEGKREVEADADAETRDRWRFLARSLAANLSMLTPVRDSRNESQTMLLMLLLVERRVDTTALLEGVRVAIARCG
jgi:hypothetical protein